jgi:preprotein translocase subunit SecD
MMIKRARFNIYLFAGMALLLTCGCDYFRPKEKREVATVSLHLEEDPDGLRDIGPISVYRSSPVFVSVNKVAFMDSRQLESASVVDEPGGLFSVRLKFDWEGTAILDSTTSSNPGRRIAIDGDFKEKRWLAAPLIRRRISDGVLTFTPDMTHEEAERLVRGLNNVAEEMKKDNKHQSAF